MAILKWLVSAVIGPLLDSVAGFLRDRQARADAVALGQAQQRAVDAAMAAEAQKTLAEAAAEPRGREVSQKALDDGRF